MNRTIRSISLLLISAALAPRVAPAAQIDVDTVVDADPGDHQCSLREAIQAARDHHTVDTCAAGDGVDTIVLPAGTYTFHGREYFQNPAPGSSLEIRSATLSAASVVVDLGGVDAFLELDNGDLIVTLHQLTIQDGAADYGGAVSADQDTLVVDGVRFLDNAAAQAGGAIYTSGARALTVTGSLFQGNTAGASGGAVAAFSNGTGAPVRLADDDFVINSVPSTTLGFGGAVTLDASGGVASCIRSMFNANSVASDPGGVAQGGGLFVSASGGGVVRLSDLQLFKNSVSGGAGTRSGGLDAAAGAQGTIDADRIVVAATGASTSPLRAWDVRLSTTDPTALISLTDAQITGGPYDGIFADVQSGRVDLGQLTVAKYANGTGVIARVSDGSSLRLQNSLLAHNQADVDLDPGAQESANCRGISSPSFPGFVDEPNGNFRLAPTSAAVDAGLDHQPTQRAADLDHHARAAGAHPDCGAYELGGLFAEGFEDGDLLPWSAAANNN